MYSMTFTPAMTRPAHSHGESRPFGGGESIEQRNPRESGIVTVIQDGPDRWRLRYRDPSTGATRGRALAGLTRQEITVIATQCESNGR